MEIYVDVSADDDLNVFLEFRSRALGWMLVAGGGFLLALKETDEVLTHFKLPYFIFWVALIVMAYVSISFTVISARRRAEFNARSDTSKAK